MEAEDRESMEADFVSKVYSTLIRLRIRKCRPDLEKITGVLMKEHGLTRIFIYNMLENLTDEHKIVRVVYKGSVSYKNCQQLMTNSDISIEKQLVYSNSFILNSNRVSSAVVTAVDHLSSTSGTSASFENLENYLNMKTNRILTKSPLSVVLAREVNAGNLMKVDSNRYATRGVKKAVSNDCMDRRITKRENSKRVKKMKKIFDPSESSNISSDIFTMKNVKECAVNLETSASSGKSFESKSQICDLCSKDSTREVILVCQLCSTPFHPLCLGYSKELSKVIQSKPWVCMDCKTCKVCMSNEGKLIFCDLCDDAYHMRCHTPAVIKKPIGEWVCIKCRGAPAGRGRPPKHLWSKLNNSQPIKLSPGASEECASQSSNTSAISKVCETLDPEIFRNHSGSVDYKALMDYPIDQNIPDISDWSAAQVANYFSRCGFGKQSKTFEDNEVDGAALLLMSRADIVSNLGFKLGPAVKIFNYVKLLQSRRTQCLDFCYFL